MADLTGWDPFRELITFRQAFDRLFEDSFIGPASGNGTTEGIRMDMAETDTDVIVKATMPGTSPQDADISVTGNVLTIKGQNRPEEPGKKAHYIFREIGFVPYSRSVTLPVAVNTDKARASFENGILTLVLPRVEEVKPRQIKVKTRTVIEGKKA